jgi:anti-sigma B factor antagonist
MSSLTAGAPEPAHDDSTGAETSRASSESRRHTGLARAVDGTPPEPFAVEVDRRGDLTIVQPRGELDIASVHTLRAALDAIEIAGRLVLDLRGLSFIDSTGLNLLVALNQRAQRDGFELSLLAPGAIKRPIQLSGLDETLPLVATIDATRPSR